MTTTNRKYCHTCGRYKLADGGTDRLDSQGKVRWRCAACVASRSASLKRLRKTGTPPSAIAR